MKTFEVEGILVRHFPIETNKKKAAADLKYFLDVCSCFLCTSHAMQIFTILCLHLISQKLNWPLKIEIVIMLLNSAKTSNYAVKVSNLFTLKMKCIRYTRYLLMMYFEKSILFIFGT